MKSNFKKRSTPWIQFLGGRDLLFTLAILIMIGLVIFLYNYLDFIFKPLVLLVSNALLPFLVSLIMYYLLSPLVDFLDRKGMNRTLAIALLYIAIIGLIVYAVMSAIPVLQSQFNSFLANLPHFVRQVSHNIGDWVDNTPLNVPVENLLLKLEAKAADIQNNLGSVIGRGLSGVTTFLSGAFSMMMTALMVPIILFFFLKDGSEFFEGFIEKLPPVWRNDIARIGIAMDVQVGSYIKGQLTVAFVNGVLMYIGFSLIGLNYAALIAIMGGFLSIIPYLGPTLTFVPALLIALTQSWAMVGKLILVWLIVQFVEGNLVEPNVMGKQLNVHPLTIIIILLVAGDLLGLFGLIFGVPLYAIIKVFVTYGYQRFKKRYNRFYGDREEGMYQTYELKEVYLTEEEEKRAEQESEANDDYETQKEIYQKADQAIKHAEEKESEKVDRETHP